MSVTANLYNNLAPIYFHRECENDIGSVKHDQTWLDQAKRITLVALPFISLYKPLSFPLAVGLGTLRIFSTITQLMDSIQNGSAEDKIYHLLQTTIAIIALGGTIFAHPIGMLITTAQDLIIELSHLIKHIRDNEKQKAFESCMNIVNNALYFSLFVGGGLEIGIASLAMQIIIGLYHSHHELKDGHWIEAASHFGMAMFRGNQVKSQVQVLQWQLKLQALHKEGFQKFSSIPHTNQEAEIKFNDKQNAISQELLDIIIKYSSNPNNTSPLHYAIEIKDFKSAEILIKEEAYLNSSDIIELKSLKPGIIATKYRAPPLIALFLFSEVNPDSLLECYKLMNLIIDRVDVNSIVTCKYSEKRNWASRNHSIGGWVEYPIFSINQGKYLMQRFSEKLDSRIHPNDLHKPAILETANLLTKRGFNISAMPDLLYRFLINLDMDMLKFFIGNGVRIDDVECLYNLGIGYPNSDAQKIIEIINFLRASGLNLNKPAFVNPQISQLDAFLHRVVALPEHSDQIKIREFKKTLIPYLISIGGKFN